MTTNPDIPSLVGYRPEEAEAVATAHGLAIIWQDDVPPRWLSPHQEPRVGRQRQREDGTLELLRVLIPSLPEDVGDAQS